MKREEFKKKINDGNIGNFYIFCGHLNWLKKLYIKRLKEAFLENNNRYEKIELENEEQWEELKSNLISNSLFSHHQMFHIIINFPIKNLFPIQSKNLILIDTEKCLPTFDERYVVSMEKIRNDELTRYISYVFSKHKKSFNAQLPQYIVNNLSNPAFLEKFLEKLMLYLGDQKDITSNSIDTFLSFTPQTTAYNVIQAILKKDLPQTLKEIDNLSFLSVHPSILVATAATIFFNIVICKTMDLEGIKHIKDGLKILKYRREAERISLNELTELVLIFYDFDLFLKKTGEKGAYSVLKGMLIKWMNT
jgi:DNA polymerase-3 subunit delta